MRSVRLTLLPLRSYGLVRSKAPARRGTHWLVADPLPIHGRRPMLSSSGRRSAGTTD